MDNQLIRLIEKLIYSKLKESQAIKRDPAEVVSADSSNVKAVVRFLNGSEYELLNKTGEVLTAGDSVWVDYRTLPSSGYIALRNGESEPISSGIGSFYNGDKAHALEVLNDYTGSNEINLTSEAIIYLEHIILAGTRQIINYSSQYWNSVHKLFMWGDNNTVNITNGDAIGSLIMGLSNTVNGSFNACKIVGDNNSISNSQLCYILGRYNAISSVDECYIVGEYNSVGMSAGSGSRAMVFGNGAQCTGSYAAYGACALGANPTLKGATTALAVGMSSPLADHNGMTLTTTGDLNVYGTVNSNVGADYAEYEEWQDGNADNEDRRGRFVMETGKFIRLAGSEDDAEDVLGIVSAAPTVCGDAHGMDWKGRFEKDIFGSLIYKDQEFTDQEGNTHTVKAEVETAEYDSTREYVARSERKEFSPVAYIGKVVAVDDGTCEVDGYCKPSEGGIATKSEKRTRFRVRKRIDDTHVLVRIR